MPTILSIETSSDLASAALLHGNNVFERVSSGVKTHSQSIIPMVQSVLAQAEIELKHCDAIAFGSGPGSFTGVRTACAIAQGLAFGTGLPVIPVVTLLAMAEACRREMGAVSVLAILDARMNEVYWAQYRYENGWNTVIPPTLSAASDVMPLGEVVVCGNGLDLHAAMLNVDLHASARCSHVMPHAIHVAYLARDAIEHGNTVSARDAQPLYLRNKIALTAHERSLKLNPA